MDPEPNLPARPVLDLLDQGVLLLDPAGCVLTANAAARALCAADPLGRPVDQVDLAPGATIVVRALPIDTPTRTDGDGGDDEPRAAGGPVVSVAVITAASADHVALRAILEQIPASVIRLDHELHIVNVSDLWLLATGLRREDVIGAHLHDIGMPARVRNDLEPLVDGVLATGRRARIETLVPTTVGLRWVEFVFVAERDAGGTITHVLGLSNDVTLRKNRELSLTRDATTDPLTGLLNRSGLNDELRRRAGEPSWATTALLLIDLDGFKQVNDRHGHLAGDGVLVEVARRIGVAAGARNPVARLGGDEFVVIGSAADHRRLAESIQRAFDRPVDSDGRTLRIGLSIGIARVATADEDVADVFNRADEAMYRAKRTGAGVVVDGA